MASSIWLGARRLAIKPDGVEFDYAGDRVTAVITYTGPYEMCLANKPDNGASVSGFGALKVDRSVVRKGPAPGAGELVVYLSDDTEDDTEASGKPITEIFWLESEVDLLRHPRYTTGGAKALTIIDRRQIDLWKLNGSPSGYGSYYWQKLDPLGNEVEGGRLSTEAEDYAAKFAKGQDSYLVYTPIAVLTTFSRAKPSSVRICGKRVAKPFNACPDGYEWLRTADRHTRSGRHGKWQRTQQFTGALIWDHDLYEEEAT